MKRMWIVSFSVVVLVLVLAAHGLTATPAPTPVSNPKTLAEIRGKVTVWYDSGAAWNVAITKINEEFKKKAPNIQVEWATQDAAQLSAKLVAAFSAGAGPDITLGAQARLTTAEQQYEAWADLTPYIQRDKEFAATVAALPESQLNTYRKGSKLWGLPEVVQTVGLFARKSWMQEVRGDIPTDWAELIDLARKMTKPGQFGYCIFGAPGVTNSAGVQFVYSSAAAGVEYPIMDPSGKLTFNSPRAIEVAKWLYRWHHTDKITPPATPTFTHAGFYEAVQAGACGLGRVGAWNVGAWKASKIGEDFVVFPYPPMVKGQKEPNYQVAWNNGIVMQAKPKDPEAVFAFFTYLMSKEAQTIFFPVRTSWSRTDLDFGALMGNNERLLYFSRLQKHYAPEQMVVLPAWLSILDIVSKHLNAMLADPRSDPEKTVKTAYDEAVARCKEIGGCN